MAEYDYDLFVIGVGSGGVRAARMSASYGARVATAEREYMGGTCVNVGCVPKKLFVYASHFAEEFHDAKGFGWNTHAPSFNWQTLVENKNAEITRLNGVYEGLLSQAGVTHYSGHAHIVDAHTIRINGQQITTDKIMVATGSTPRSLVISGQEHMITSNEAFYLDELPKRVLVIGGGYIAVEFAGIFNGLGVDTHLSYRGPLFMRGFDEDIRTMLADEMVKKGVSLHFNTLPGRIEKHGKVYKVFMDDGDVLETDLVMCAIGRVPAVYDLGLDNAGVACSDNGAILVDDEFRTNVPNIFALGDVIDRYQLTPVAIEEAMCFASGQYLKQPKKMDYANIPTAVFSQPNIGTVGLTEEEAKTQYDNIDVYRSSFRALKHTLSGNDEKTMMKMIVDRDSDRVVGVHMLGADAGEIIQGIGIALKAGATKAIFDATIGIHPTSAEEFVTMREPVV